MFEEIVSDESNYVSQLTSPSSDNNNGKLPEVEKNSVRHEMKTIQYAFEQHGSQCGFRPTILVIPSQRSSKFKL